MAIYKKFVGIIGIYFVVVFPACSYITGTGSDELQEEHDEVDLSTSSGGDQAEANSKKRIRKSEVEKINLRLAQIWTRLDDLELKTNRTAEAQKVLEKSLLLGITPKSVSSESFSPNSADNEAKPEPLPNKEEITSSQGNNENVKSLEEFESSFAQALTYYRSGEFGKAVVELNQLKKIYGDHIKEGIHLYWLGKSWISLNDFSAAERYLADYIEKFPASPLVPRAKLDLARANYRGGKSKQAVSLLKGIIDEYPEEDVAEMARLELERQRRN